MEITQFFEAVNKPDPNDMINSLQLFFQKINATNTGNAFDLVSLYSTADVLLANGMNEKTVKVIKMAAKARMIALYKQYSHSTKEAAKAMYILINTDESLSTSERTSADLL